MAGKTPPGSSPAKPLDVSGDAADDTPEIAEAKSAPQWVVLIEPLTVDTPERDPVTYEAGRCVRLPAARSRSLVGQGRARLARQQDLNVGAALARDLVAEKE